MLVASASLFLNEGALAARGSSEITSGLFFAACGGLSFEVGTEAWRRVGKRGLCERSMD